MRFPISLACAVAVAAVPGAAAGPLSLVSASEEITAVSSKVHNGYARERLKDGSFKPETYAFAVGGFMSRQGDDSIDKLGFDSISKTIRAQLDGQKYLPSHDLSKIDLLIVVYWGTTFGTSRIHTMQGGFKDAIDLNNASLLGFDSDGVFGRGFADPSNMRSAILKQTHAEVMSAIEMDRYYVILLAIDFQEVWKHKKVKLLWETRISLSERRHEFDKEIPVMMQYASRYLGQDSHGLVMKPVPEGHVEIGAVKSLGDEPQGPKGDKGQAPSGP